MKLKAILAVAALALAPSLHAFTLDFASSVGTTVPMTINVPGYGDVAFTKGFSSASDLNVGTSFFGAPSLQFDNNDCVNVTFLGALPSGFGFDAVGLTSGGTGGSENFVWLQTGANQYAIQLQNSTDGAGIASISFSADSVPEPSTSLLGLVGLTGLVIRRRR